MPRFTADSVFLARYAAYTRSCREEISFRATSIAARTPERFPELSNASMATAIAARADTARRKSSEVRPPSVTNAETSQEDMRMRVFSMATVVMERPRAGGEAINCNQIFSVQASRSSGCPATGVPEVFPRGSEAEGGGEVCFGAIPGVVARDFKPLAPVGGPGAGRGFPVCVPGFAGF